VQLAKGAATTVKLFQFPHQHRKPEILFHLAFTLSSPHPIVFWSSFEHHLLSSISQLKLSLQHHKNTSSQGRP
jgi:hypothetical protein